MYNDLLIGHLTIYLIGAVAALVLHMNNRLRTYAAFVSAFIAPIFGAIFVYSIIIGDTLSFTIAGSSIYSMGYVKEYYSKKNIGFFGFRG